MLGTKVCTKYKTRASVFPGTEKKYKMTSIEADGKKTCLIDPDSSFTMKQLVLHAVLTVEQAFLSGGTEYKGKERFRDRSDVSLEQKDRSLFPF